MAGDVNVNLKVEEARKNIRGIFELLKECLVKNKVLLESIEGSQSKSQQSSKEYNVLHSLKGRLAASEGTNEKLSSELYSLDIKLSELVEVLKWFDKDNDLAHGDNTQENIAVLEEVSCSEEKKPTPTSDNAQKQKINGSQFDANDLARELEKEFERINEIQNPTNKSDGESLEKDDMLNVLLESNRLLQHQLGESTEYFEKEVRRLQDKHKEEERHLNEVFTQLAEVKEKSENYKRLYEAEKQKNPAPGLEDKNSQFVQDRNAVNEEERSHASLGSPRRGSLDYRLLTSRSRKENYLPIRASTAGMSSARAKLLLRSSDVIRSNEPLSSEINHLREEMRNLKVQNARLSKKAAEATSQMFYMKNQLCVNHAERVELQRRFDKSREENRRLEKTLSRRANRFVEGKKMERQVQEEIRWSQISPISVLGSYDRSINSSGPKRQTTGQSRNIPVELV